MDKQKISFIQRTNVKERKIEKNESKIEIESNMR